MRFDWREISGPALTAATAVIAIFVDRNFIFVPNPAPLFICIVAFAASLSGLTSGMISAAIAVAASAVFFFDHRAMPGYHNADLVRLAMLALTAPVLLPAVALVARVRVSRFLSAGLDSMLMAFSTTSSLATLPTMLAAAEGDLKAVRMQEGK